MIEHQFKKQEEEKAFRMWLMLYPKMDEETYIPFTEFYNPKKQEVSKKSKEEIVEQAKKIRKKISQQQKSGDK